MSEKDLINYSELLLDYCLEVKSGSKLFIQSTTLAEPLIHHLYKGCLQRKAICEFSLSVHGQENVFNQFYHRDALSWINPTYRLAVQEFDTYLFIRAPFPRGEYMPLDKNAAQIRAEALNPFQKIYNQRTGDRSLRRSLCQYPTEASALDAQMNISDYEKFVLNSCFLLSGDPVSKWQELSARQQLVVDQLNQFNSFRYLNNHTDIQFSTTGRIWINSDGRTNMPSGEVYTSPIEDSVQGHIYFEYPFLYNQQLIQGVRLEVKNGKVIDASAHVGSEILQSIMDTPGADHFGEVAIGTNPNIQRATQNILFDEKMGGTIHMALGQSYLQCGGKNESTVHQDMIADMKKGGQIWADGRMIYENGVFLF